MTEKSFEEMNKSGPKGIFIVGFVIIGLFLFFMFMNPSAKVISDSGLSVKDDQGNIWELSISTSPWKNDSKPGEPLVARADVTVSGRTLYLGAVLEGNAGETYLPAAERNGSMQNAPSYKIYDEQEKLLGSGDFTFG